MNPSIYKNRRKFQESDWGRIGSRWIYFSSHNEYIIWEVVEGRGNKLVRNTLSYYKNPPMFLKSTTNNMKEFVEYHSFEDYYKAIKL